MCRRLKSLIPILSYTPKRPDLYRPIALICLLIYGPIVAAQKTLIDESEFDLAADSLIREVESGEGARPFNELQKRIGALFNTLPPVLQFKVQQERFGERLKQIEGERYPSVTLNTNAQSVERDGASIGSSNGIDITIRQLLWDFGKNRLQQSALESERLQSNYSTRLERSAALKEIVLAIVDLQRAKKLEYFAVGFVQTRKNFVNFIRSRRELGASSDLDVIRAEAKLADSLQRVTDAKLALARANEKFRRLVGLLPPDIPLYFYREPVLADLSRLVDDSPDGLPKVASQLAAVERAKSKLEEASVARFGQVTISYSNRASDPTTTGYRRQGTWRLAYDVTAFDGFASDARQREASLALAEEVYVLEQLRRDVREEAVIARQVLLSQRKSLRDKLALLRNVRAVDAATRQMFILGRATLTDVFREQEAHFDAASGVITEFHGTQSALYEYLHRVDRLLQIFELES